MNDIVIVGGYIAAFVAALFLLIGIPVGAGIYYTDRGRCHSFGEQSNREVKFVVYTRVIAPLTWDCLTPTADGKWISTSNLREFGEQP